MPAASYRAISSRPLATVPAVSKDRRASVFGRDAARHDLQDLEAEGDEQAIHDVFRGLARVVLHGLGQQRLVVVLLHGLQDQRRVGGRVARGVGLHALEVAGVGDHGGVLLELFELVHGGGFIGQLVT
jgi:hypothetical protein